MSEDLNYIMGFKIGQRRQQILRGGIIAIGLFLVILGILLFSSGSNMIQEIEAYDVYDLPISELLKTISDDARTQYETGQAMIMFGGIFGFVGFILCIAGIAAPSNKPKVIVQQPVKKEVKQADRRCPECGRIIPNDAKMCPYCGKKFKSYVEKEDKQIKEEKRGEEPTSTVKKEEKTSLAYCPKCGEKLDEGVEFCTECGEKLE